MSLLENTVENREYTKHGILITFTFPFEGKEQYLQWRTEWRTEYKTLAQEIRNAKANRRKTAIEGDTEQHVHFQWLREKLREDAQQMMAMRVAGKLESIRQKFNS
jgi:hypothetical protein